MTEGESFAVEDVGEPPDLVLGFRQQGLEGGHEGLHHVRAGVSSRVEDVRVVEDHSPALGVPFRQHENVAEINLRHSLGLKGDKIS